MGRILIFSDLHLYSFKPYSTILPNGLNSRLQDGIDILDQIISYVNENEIDGVIFGGDNFHVRKHIEVAAFNTAYEKFSKLSSICPVLSLLGNHDTVRHDGSLHSLETFNRIQGCQVIDKPDWYSWCTKSGKRINICAQPYTEDFKGIKKLIKSTKRQKDISTLFLGHFGTKSSKISTDFVYSNPHDPEIKDLLPKTFDAGFLGHFHLYQDLGHNFWHVGSPLAHNWSDKNEEKGCLIYDTETKTHEFVPLKSPRFIELSDGGTTNLNGLKDNYVRMISTLNWSQDQIESTKEVMKARSFEIIDANPLVLKSQPRTRLEIQPGITPQDLVKMYIDSGVADTSTLDIEYLKMIGKEMLDGINDV